jgi:hypothetical protein
MAPSIDDTCLLRMLSCKGGGNKCRAHAPDVCPLEKWPSQPCMADQKVNRGIATVFANDVDGRPVARRTESGQVSNLSTAYAHNWCIAQRVHQRRQDQKERDQRC